MITLYHTKGRLDAVLTQDGKSLVSYNGDMVTVIFEIAKAYPSSFLIWCDSRLKDHLNISKITQALVHKNIMLSCGVSGKQYLPEALHYVEESPFLKINTAIKYPTWQMHAHAGVVHAQVINQCDLKYYKNESFEYVLNSIAKACQSQGLFCYQLPILKEEIESVKEQASSAQLYRFVKQHYKSQWVFFLFIAQLLFDKKFMLFSMLSSLSVRKKQIDFIPEQLEPKTIKSNATVDVIIPTMGRATYLHDVLKDFALQTHLPEKVIIVEQNPEPDSTTDLDFIKIETWPFKIEHSFIHETGACNARNLALAQTTADWVFFADDDNRFVTTVIEDSLQYLQQYDMKVFTTSYLQRDEKKVFTIPKQWTTFGAGNSFVLGTLSRKIKFNTAYEHGYGEDADYGMQLRNLGVDILYHPDIDLLHLKAPVGGFRHKIVHPWDNEKDRPKPSPTVMLFKSKYLTEKQLKGYKLKLYLNMLKNVPLMNKIGFKKAFLRRWNTSLKWAGYLDSK